DPRKALAAAGERLSDWHQTRKPRVPLPAPAPVERAVARGDDRVLIQHRPRSAQVEMRLSCTLPRVTARNHVAQSLFARRLSTYFLTRLRLNVGASYSASADLDRLWGGTSVVQAHADVSYDRLTEALVEVRRYTELPSS